MAGFEFKVAGSLIEIDGHNYYVDFMEVERYEAMTKAAINLAYVGEDIANMDAVERIKENSRRTHEVIKAALGEETYAKVYENRAHSLIEDMRLAKYLNDKFNEQNRAAQAAALAMTPQATADTAGA